MRVKPAGGIRLPKSAAGNLDHFDVVGLEALVDRTDRGHARWRYGRLGTRPNAWGSDQQCRYEQEQALGAGFADHAHTYSDLIGTVAGGKSPARSTR